ncbi:MAG: helix-turn-helix domain-containing protein, partial [Solirubrobacteraceae bacterium]
VPALQPPRAGTRDAQRARRVQGLRLPLGVLQDTIGEVICVIIPDPEAPGLRAALERSLTAAGARAGLGTTVGWGQAAVSFARARAALALRASGPLISARDHAGELLLAADGALAAEFAAAQLAPLASLPPGSQERLRATLGAWLDEQGRLKAVAARLGVHPQTARYRLARLRELFGDALDDPERRFWLAVALKATR